ncbi:LacI family DNA-binding transcriptional regulator [Novosphingobium mathurense]|uniref:Transcriptional regulator, LacI family n=1 Tax=Novosphingobium mathurense TaxID=428990 RepID=A0A1U6IXR2_9SPHN|nr:LacI family DNA-binding transcriptional regulator [Novosphingobium mathurense]SLK12800.1 transcriptional regulator, LacI family [Novosphingobium mathurense]
MSTISDVAKKAGVSTATVSRVMSTPSKVAKATRVKVTAAMDSLGYSPNNAAKSLRTLRTNKILVTVQDIMNPFCNQFIKSVEHSASAAGYSVLLGDTGLDAEREEQYVKMLWQREADGLIVLGRMPQSLMGNGSTPESLAPIVNACGFTPDLAVPSVYIDNTRAAEQVIDYLDTQGHKGIGVVAGAAQANNSRLRLIGVEAAAARHSSKITVANAEFSIEAGLAATLKLLEASPRPTAIFCFSDEMAIGALEAFHKLGLKCPDDISLVGFDDIRYAKHLSPALTTVKQPMQAVGEEVFRTLLDILTNKTTLVRHVMLPHKLQVRNSVRNIA